MITETTFNETIEDIKAVFTNYREVILDLRNRVERLEARQEPVEPIEEQPIFSASKYRRWEDYEDSLIHHAVDKETTTTEEIAYALKRTHDSVVARAYRLGYFTKDYIFIVSKES